jgi:hypothetical protein
MDRRAFLMRVSRFGGGLLSVAAVGTAGGAERAAGGTVLGIAGSQFTVNGAPTFLLGFSYYGGLGASEEHVRQDLEDFKRRGFNWLRVWATWDAFEHVISAVDTGGRPREPFLGKLRWLVAECDRRAMIVDVTLSRREDTAETGGGQLPDSEAHERAVETLCEALRPHRNWFLDLANERDVRDARYVEASELKRLRERVRRLDRERLVTASFGGHDLSREDLREALFEIHVDFLSRHRPRTADSPAQTEAKSRECLEMMRALGRVVPLLDQEPFRRGYGRWQPAAKDFLMDLEGSMAGGAAGWCFHNGTQRGAPEERPRRSFDLRERRLWAQLDSEEKRFVEAAGAVVRKGVALGD